MCTSAKPREQVVAKKSAHMATGLVAGALHQCRSGSANRAADDVNEVRCPESGSSVVLREVAVSGGIPIGGCRARNVLHTRRSAACVANTALKSGCKMLIYRI